MPPGSNTPIGVFDSGVGGLSVLREIRAALPAEDLLYVADSGFAPYGERSGEFVRERAEAIGEFFAGAGVKAMVVACNTATALAVKVLRSRHRFPIVAIEPALKPAAAMSRSGVVGILATSQTLASESFSRLVEQHGQGVQVLPQACPGLVEQVEKGDLESAVTQALVERYVRPLLEKKADTLVLGCTHFPFLRAAIAKVAGQGVSVLDPALAVARELARRLEAGGLLVPGGGGSEQFWTSGSPDRVQRVLGKLWSGAVDARLLPAEFLRAPLGAGLRARLDALFVPEQRARAAALLETECGIRLPLIDGLPGIERVRCAVLKLSGGSMEKLAEAVRIARIDWRDTLVAAGFGHDVRAHLAWLGDESDLPDC